MQGNFYDYEALELQERAIYRNKSCSVDAASEFIYLEE